MKPLRAISTQINYAGMMWLLAAQVAVMLPFLTYLPLWLVSVLLISTAWRIRVLRGHLAQPIFLVKAGVVFIGVFALAISGLEPLSLDMMSSLLLLAFAFKAIEVIHRRDAVVVIFTGYFLVAVQFLYSQSIGTALYGLICMLLLTAALIAIQQNQPKQIGDHLKLAGLMLVQCLPLMIIVYLFFPRLPPLWAVSLPSDQARSGISDQMSPGDIANLSQSDDPAFRVSFKGRRPQQNQLYWRGLTLNYFDGVGWQQFGEQLALHELENALRVNPESFTASNPSKANPVNYEVIYEPSRQPWLFTLSSVTDWEGDAILGFDYRLMATRALHAPIALKVQSVLGAKRDQKPSQVLEELSLQLPGEENPRALALARKWRSEAGSDQAYAQRVMAHFHKQLFYYTLRPPLTGQIHTIDEFLFNTKSGFCSHYAGSFVFLMRAAGIPARVILGYQGGEWNEADQYLTVRQYDAHAWTEIWFEDAGWVRFDPTAMVAPERIEQNLQVAVKDEGSFLEQDRFSMVHISWLNGPRIKWDALQYGWRRWVLGYDHNRQNELLTNWLGKISVMRIAIIFSGLFALVMIFWLAWLGFLRFTDDGSPSIKLYRELCKKLEKRGLSRPPAIAPNQFSDMAAERFPEKAQSIREATMLFEQMTYAKHTIANQDRLLKRLKALIRQI